MIENKVCSLPDTVQLNAYAAGKLHGLDRPVLVLLSLVAPGWPDGSWTTPNGLTWRYRSYEELCAGLRSCLPDLRRTDGFGADVSERWLDLIDKPVRLVAEVGSPAGAEPLLLPVEAVAVLKSARLDATVQKMRCLHVSSLVRAKLVREIAQDGVIVRTAMSRGQGIVEMFTAETTPCFGRQIQEGQFRLVYLTGPGAGHGPGQTRRAAREQEARAYGDYFCFDQARTLLGDIGPERPVTAPNAPLAFNGFAPLRTQESGGGQAGRAGP